MKITMPTDATLVGYANGFTLEELVGKIDQDLGVYLFTSEAAARYRPCKKLKVVITISEA